MSTDTLPLTDDAAAFVDGLLAAVDPAFVVDIAEELERRRVGTELERVMRVWQLSLTDLGGLFAVSRQAVSKWVRRGIPDDRIAQVTDVLRITDLLERYLKGDRIPAVVRRPAPALDGDSLVELVTAGRSDEAVAMTRRMFTFGDAHA